MAGLVQFRGFRAHIRGLLNRVNKGVRVRPRRDNWMALAGERGQFRNKLRRGWVEPVEIKDPGRYLHSSRKREIRDGEF